MSAEGQAKELKAMTPEGENMDSRVGAGPSEPRCPKCGSGRLSLAFSFAELRVSCHNNHTTGVHYAKDFAQFFPASQQVPQSSDVPICMHCGCYESAHRGGIKFCPAIYGAHTFKASAGPAATAQPTHGQIETGPTLKEYRSIAERGATPGEPAQVKEKP